LAPGGHGFEEKSTREKNKGEAHENWKTTTAPIEKKLRATLATTEFYWFIFFITLFILLIMFS